MPKPTKKARKMLAPVLAWLDAGASEATPKGVLIEFNMEKFISHDTHNYKNENCGTVCCLAGAISQFNDICQIDGDTPLQFGITKVAIAMEMTKSDSDRLFYAHDSGNRGGIGNMTPAYMQATGAPLAEITPEMAAKTIRDWIDTGEINWK